MPHACLLLRSGVPYRRQAFAAGLERVGFNVDAIPKRHPDPADVLVLWNRKGAEHTLALAYEKAGARVLIAENGYIGKAPDGHKLYALAWNHHNGRGTWREGGPERWDALGIDLAPWRTDGDFILVLPQRGIGEPGVAMPGGWAASALKHLATLTKRPLRIRHHPGVEKAEPYEALQGAHCAVTWGSGAGLKALAAGVPVFHALKGWIGAGMASSDLSRLEDPPMPDRVAPFRRLAWSQWAITEIESGQALAWMLEGET